MEPEYIPVDAYQILTRLRHGNIPIPGGNPDVDAAVDFLLSRRFATVTVEDSLTITDAGREVGRLTKNAPERRSASI
jgi:hypothetical protein